MSSSPTVRSPRSTRRSPLAVLGLPSIHFGPTCTSDDRTLSTRSSSTTSDQRRAHASPRRRPVKARNSYGCGSPEGTSGGLRDDVVGVAGSVNASLFLAEVVAPLWEQCQL